MTLVKGGKAGSEAGLIDDLVTANRILYARKIVDAFGHVSARCPDNPSNFLMARSMPPAHVTKADIMLHGPDGEPCDGPTRTPYLERFVHSGIYAARPDVMAVVHSHSLAMLTFACVPSAALHPMSHMAAFLGQGVARFEIRDIAGDATDLLIRSPRLGADLAGSLGPCPLVLMRGHGSTVVGASVRQATFRAVYAEINAGVQLGAMKLGEPTYLSKGEVSAAAPVVDGQINRAWDLWCDELKTG